MDMISINPVSVDDAKLKGYNEKYLLRVEALPPGACPLTTVQSLLNAGKNQSCGKCTPCADGLPALFEMSSKLLECSATQESLDEMRLLAQMIRDTSDCAIGYEAANAFLQGLDTFATEVQSHLNNNHCQAGVGQSVPCETMCPAHVNVPAYLSLVAKGDCAGAVNMVRKDNPFPTACALVCEHPCEEPCRRNLIDAPLNIRGVKKYAVDAAPVDQIAVPKRLPNTNRRIAIIGAGPAGLTCAYFLSLMGHSVKIFESRASAGGMLRYGIPAYRFPRERLDQDINAILAVGEIEIEYNVEVDTDHFKQLNDEYDATFIAIGAHTAKGLRIDNVCANGVFSAVEMLREIGDGIHPDYTGKKVVVIGGGNVAMDCARSAIRLGAEEVSVVYRRRLSDMTALKAEVEAAIAEGVEMIVLESPVAVDVDDKNNCKALITQPQMIGAVRGDRPAPVNADKPQGRIQADIILLAIGQDVVSAPFEEAGVATEWKNIVTNDFLQCDGFERVFSGGDCQTGPSTVIKAIAAGKVAARNIDTSMGYYHKLHCDVEVPAPAQNIRKAYGRVEITERPARERKHDFELTENGMSEQEVRQECSRCLRCDFFGAGTQHNGRHQYV